MSDRWTDERDELDRIDRERRYGRYRRDEYSASDHGARDYGERSFNPRERDTGRSVFGERESGASYASPRYGERPRHGPDQQRGGRFYAQAGRDRPYRDDYRPSSITQGGPSYMAGGYGQDRQGEGRWRDDDEHAYRVAYGDHHPDHKGHYEPRESARREDRNFWERASDRVAAWFGEGDYDVRAREGEHRGRGPTGYKRADERINDEAHERLTDDPWVDATAIAIAVSGGEVTLSGTVPEREAKHRAERIVENLSGVTHVQNNLRVQRTNPLTDAGRGFGDSASASQMNEPPKTPRGN